MDFPAPLSSFKSALISSVCVLFASAAAFGQAIPQKNVNAIGPTPLFWLYAGNPRMQQNEPECAVSPNNPEWLACGFNDYRAVNDAAIGDAFPGIAMSRDSGKSWISGLTPQHLKDIPNIDQKYGADANLEALPNLLLYNFIAGWRDDSKPGGVYVSRWFEHNRDVGPPWEFLDTVRIDLGTSGRFLDKPAFDVSLRDPSLGLPDIQIPIPAYEDKRNKSNSYDAYTLSVPAARAHICYAVFVGNDNNNGTKINCLASDDGGATWPVSSKLTEGVEINQGVSVATSNFGQDVMAVWRRFSDNNETSAVMFAKSTDAGATWGKAEVLTEFCAFDQGTGAARFRTNALPVVVSSGSDFAVYFASRNNATETCVVPAKGKNPAVVRMSDVADADDFDTYGEPDPVNGVRQKDGKVRTSLNFSRIMMVRGSGNSARSWSTPVAVDPQVYPAGALNKDGSPIPAGARIRGHQFMPAAEAAGGLETVAWYDSRLDKLNTRSNPIAGGYVEDLVVHLEPPAPGSTNPNAWQSVSLLPAGLYDLTPPPPNLPPPGNNIPLRRSLDVFAAQIDASTGQPRTYTVNSDFHPEEGGSASPSTRVTRFATRPKAGGGREQVEFNYPNGRLFRKGKSPFIGDYNSVFAAQFRQRQDGTWVPNQTAPVDSIDLFESKEPMFHVGWTSNRNVRGKVYYTGCDVWNEALQMWETSAECDSVYTDPVARMAPLQGEDGGADGPPLVCLPTAPGSNFPLTRNQNIFTAAMKPGITVNVLSAVKRPVGSINTFVVGLDNGSPFNRHVVLELPAGTLTSFTTDVDGTGAPIPDLSIPVTVPRGSSNTRTVFDFGNAIDPDLPDTVVLTVRECIGTNPTNPCSNVSAEALAKVPLLRSSQAPLENVQNNPAPCTDPDPANCEAPVNLVGEGEFYDLILKREGTFTQLDLENLDLENLDLENTVQMLDLENLDLENLDLENLDLENLDLENVVLFLDLENLDLENLDLENALYENLDLENLDLENRSLFYLDLENLDLENTFLQFLDLENLDLENLDLENLDLENLDLENLDLENFTVYASDLENLDLENLDLENTAPGDEFTEISWTADSATNTTTGVDVKPIFSPNLANLLSEDNTNFKVLLTVRRPYMTGTVVNNVSSSQYCAPQVVVENQLLFAAILNPDQINSLTNDPDPNTANTPSFVIAPDQSTIITLRFINPPAGLDADALNANSGMAVFSQPGGTFDCDDELGGNEVFNICEVDYQEPDNQAPAITVNGANPDSVNEDSGLYSDPGATAIDDRDGPVAVTVGGWNGDTSQPGTYTITYSATDAAFNTANASRSVTVNDVTPPVLALNAGPSTTEAGFAYSDPGASATDNVAVVGPVTSDAATVADTSVHGTSFTVTYKAKDAAGNEGSITRTVSVADTTAPVIVPNLVAGALDVTVEAGTAYSDAGATVTDNVLPPPLLVTYSDEAGNPLTAVNTDVVGNYYVHYNATDAAGNAAAQVTRTVTVQDTTTPAIVIGNPPAFDPSLDQAVLEPGETEFQISWPVGAQDLEADLTITCSIGDPPQVISATSTEYDSTTGTLNAVFTYGFSAGTTTGTCTVTDQGGNSVTSDPFTVLVEDRPVIDTTTLPTLPFTVEANSPSGYTGPIASLWSPILATDQVDTTPIEAVCTPTNDLVLGVNTISCTATDSAGNVSDTVTFDVTVLDTTAPVITTIVPDITVEANAASGYAWSVPAAGLWPSVYASDTVDGTVEAVCEPASTDDFALAAGESSTTHTVTCIARDSAGNPDFLLQPGDPDFPAGAYTTFTVTVQDTLAPVIGVAGTSSLPSSITLEAMDASGYTPASALWTDPVANAALDIVDGLVPATCTGPSEGGSLGPNDTFPLGLTQVYCTATDSRGNVTPRAPAFTVTVGDSTPPSVSISVGQSNPVEATGPGGTSVSFTASATDSVYGSLTTSCTVDSLPVTSPHTFALGSSILSCTARDEAGNQGSAMTTVTVVDTTAPSISTSPLRVETEGTSASVSEAALLAKVTASDLVDGAAVTVACPLPTDPTSFALGEHAIQCTATDSRGNSASATLTLTVAFKYDFTLSVPKGNITAGSVAPIDWYYTDPVTGARVDSSTLLVAAKWVGPYENRNCGGGSSGAGNGAAAIDAGSSAFRYSSSQNIWQLSWQTPSLTGSYLLTVSPPGTPASTQCIYLK